MFKLDLSTDMVEELRLLSFDNPTRGNYAPAFISDTNKELLTAKLDKWRNEGTLGCHVKNPIGIDFLKEGDTLFVASHLNRIESSSGEVLGILEKINPLVISCLLFYDNKSKAFGAMSVLEFVKTFDYVPPNIWWIYIDYINPIRIEAIYHIDYFGSNRTLGLSDLLKQKHWVDSKEPNIKIRLTSLSLTASTKIPYNVSPTDTPKPYVELELTLSESLVNKLVEQLVKHKYG